MVIPSVVNIRFITVFKDILIHTRYCFRLRIVWAYMHTLYAQTFIICEKLRAGTIEFFLSYDLIHRPCKIRFRYKTGSRIKEIQQ